MSSFAQICDPNRLDAFLRGELNATEELNLMAHLDECADCCQQLEQQAAERESWDEALQFLKPRALDGPCAAAVAHSGIGQRARRPPQIQSVIDPLGPPLVRGASNASSPGGGRRIADRILAHWQRIRGDGSSPPTLADLALSRHHGIRENCFLL